MIKLFLILTVSLCLVGCGSEEVAKSHLRTHHIELEEDGSKHICIPTNGYITYTRDIDGKWKVLGTDLTAENLRKILTNNQKHNFGYIN